MKRGHDIITELIMETFARFSVKISPLAVFFLSLAFGGQLNFSTGLNTGTKGRRSDLVARVAAASMYEEADSSILLPKSHFEARRSGSMFEESIGLPYLLSDGEEFTVEVKNSGPAILGSTAHFVAKVRTETELEKNGGLSASSSYWYTWKGDVKPLPQNFLTKDVCSFNLSLTNSSGARPGELSITVTVCKADFLWMCLGKKVDGYSKIEVTETINGQILMNSKSIPQCNSTSRECTVPSKANVSLSASIYDPTNFFAGAQLIYGWDMGDGRNWTTTLPEIVYSYRGRGVYAVTLNITAVLKNGEKKYGYWQKNITVLDALTNLQIKSSSKSVEVGNREMVNVTCDGSPPIKICLTILEPTQPRNATNTTCDTIVDERCETVFTHYFQTTGKYMFEVAAHNNVSYLLNSSSISAHEPTLPPQSITAITLAVIAGVFMTCVAMVAFVQQVQKNRKPHVEVANFDFQLSERSPSPRPGLFKWWRWRSPEKQPLLRSQSSHLYSL